MPKNNIELIREARPQDAENLLALIRELAVFENEPNAVKIDSQTLIDEGFGDKPLFKCFVAEVDKQVVGMALVYFRFSTWNGRSLYLEDLIVTESMRGHGIGKALLDRVIRFGHENGVGRIGWVVLNWNKTAIDFYESVGANMLKDWYIAQMDAAAIANYIENNASI